MNAPAAHFNLGQAVTQANGDYERLLESRIADLEAAGSLTEPGTSARHCANIQLADAQVALILYERRKNDPYWALE